MYDMVIIGGGPAGLTAAIYAGRAGLKTVLIEKAMPGGLAAKTAMIENYPGFPEGISGPELMKRMEEQARKWGVEFVRDEVYDIEYDDYKKVVKARNRSYETITIVVATGSQPKRLGVPGEDKYLGRGVSYCATCDGPLFKDKDVMIVGAGNSGLQEGLFLLKYVRSITYVEVLPHIVGEKALADRLKQHENVRFYLNHLVITIEGKETVTGVRIRNRATKEDTVIPVQGVFIYVGFHPQTKFLKGKVQMDGSGYIITDENNETSIKGILAIGDVRRKFAKQIASAVGDGAAAVVAAHLYIDRVKELS
ncbi:thioredoxin-disulfide reductase [candidate division WOR-3 bacterium]|uniref:Thioredoxin reductase n=1 Tax=candidate division WOR-3 bacterium TaxID=2052148 RepID=A0A660SJU7_UNCW3|nr:MAG: thioredoxin-disulfide reductase [candidate division WOR-3 bacterium]